MSHYRRAARPSWRRALLRYLPESRDERFCLGVLIFFIHHVVRSVGLCVRREADRQALLRQAAAIAGEVREAPFSEGDRQRVAGCYRATLTALHEPPDERLM